MTQTTGEIAAKRACAQHAASEQDAMLETQAITEQAADLPRASS